MKPIIKVRNLSKVYFMGDEHVIALKNINLDIMKGEICCIFGTSGSGKSTLLNQLAGLEKPTRGMVAIGNTSISSLTENQLAAFRQEHLGFVFQAYNLLPNLTALENVAMPLMFKGITKDEREKIAARMMVRVGLKDRMDHFPSQMSGGQQQRVGIARAFVTMPKVVFADEPTGNLDSKTTKEVMEMIREFAHRYNQTIVLVSHDPEMTEYSDRIVTLIDGQIVSDVRHSYPGGKPYVEGEPEPKDEDEVESSKAAEVTESTETAETTEAAGATEITEASETTTEAAEVTEGACKNESIEASETNQDLKKENKKGN